MAERASTRPGDLVDGVRGTDLVSGYRPEGWHAPQVRTGCLRAAERPGDLELP